MTPTTTLLLRHGQTPLSVDKRFSGTGDPALTDTGRRQAAAAAVRLAGSGATAVVSSPLRRARETAALVAEALGLDVEVEDGLRETDFGDWEGYTFGEVREKWPAEMDAWLASTAVAPPFGESFDATAVRVRAGPRPGARPARAARRSSWSATSRRSRRCCGSPWTRRRRRCTGCTWTWRRCRRCAGTPTARRWCGR